MREHLPRWIFASIAKYFSTGLSDYSTYVEGVDLPDTEETEKIEIRIDGPWMREVSKDVLKINSEVNILVSVTMDSDLYKIHTIKGKVASLFLDIPIYKYGSETGDDQTLVGYFKILPTDDLKERVEIADFGQIDPNIKILQSTIEGHYEMIINL